MTDSPATPDAYQPRQRLPFAMVPRELVEDNNADPYVIAVYAALSARSNKDDVTWPSYDLLVKEAHQGRARLAKSLKWLESHRWITVTRGADDSGYRLVNIYALHESPDLSSPSELGPKFDSSDPEFDGQTSSGELELEPLELEPENKNHIATRRRDPIWDTLVELFGPPAPTRQKLYGRVNKYLHSVDATPDLIRHRAARIATDWGPEKLTITSLENNWSRFDGHAGQVTAADVEANNKTQRRADLKARLESKV